jgi:hypothetical protein
VDDRHVVIVKDHRLAHGIGDHDADDGCLCCQAKLAVGVVDDGFHAQEILVQDCAIQGRSVALAILRVVLVLWHFANDTARRVACWLVLRLLIDTSTWLDLAARRDGQKWIVPLRVLKFHGGLELLVPSLVLAEFDRNRPRSEMAVSTGMLDRIRQLRRDLRAYVNQDQEPNWLTESAQRVPLVNAMAPQNFREIDELLRNGAILEPTDMEKIRAFQRGLDKTAPFTSDKNSAADALLIESYATQVAAENADVYAFVTSNHRDFSKPNDDHREPHPDLAGLFDGSRSHYAYQVEGLHDVLLGYFGTSSWRSTTRSSS